MFNKVHIYILTIAIIVTLVLLQPVGFDFYYHLYYLQSLDLHKNLNIPHSFLGLKIDRYMAFPYIVYKLDFIKPLLLIIFFQINAWFQPMLWAIKRRNEFSGFAVFLIILFFNVFWTPLGISIGLAASYIISKSKFSLLYLLASALFHPISLLILILAPIFKKISVNNKAFCILIASLFSLFTIFFLEYNPSIQEKNSLNPSLEASTKKGDPNSRLFFTLENVNIQENQQYVSSYDHNDINKIIRTPIEIDKNLILIFSKLKEVIACLILFYILSGRHFLNLQTPTYAYLLILLITFSFLIFKSFTNGSIMGSFFINVDQSKFYDYSIYLAKNSYSSPKMNIALRKLDNDCFYSFTKFGLNPIINVSNLSELGLKKNCFIPSLHSLSIPAINKQACLRMLRNDPLFGDSTILYTIHDERVVFYSLINAYIPNYSSVKHAKLLCENLGG